MVNNKKILVVEDNELNQKLFTDLLEAHDYSVIQTKDGREAVALAGEERPEVIIMDIQLPNISGIEVIKLLKSNKDTKSIPILAVTAFAMQDDEEQILASGCEAYMSKPISIVEFVEKIKEILK